MGDFLSLFNLIPESGYRYILMGLLLLLFFWSKIPILNKIDVRVRLPDEFMRHFRWITPLLLIGLYVWNLAIYFALRAVLLRLSVGR